jgi:hypothetical protein
MATLIAKIRNKLREREEALTAHPRQPATRKAREATSCRRTESRAGPGSRSRQRALA